MRSAKAPSRADACIFRAATVRSGLAPATTIRSKTGRRLWRLQHHDPPFSPEQIADEMFLAFPSRFPRPEEKAIAVRLLDACKGEALEDLAWSFINKVKFIHNYLD
jgi:hypothetical protein